MRFLKLLFLLVILKTYSEGLPECEDAQQYKIPGNCSDGKRSITYRPKEGYSCKPKDTGYISCGISLYYYLFYNLFCW